MKRQPIRPKHKAYSPKATWWALRRRYTWYMRPPFKGQFDRSHWWKGKSEIESGAALYELVRRHPLIHEHWLKAVARLRRNHRELGVRPGHPFFGEAQFSRIILDQHWFSRNTPSPSGLPPSLYWTCLLGLKSWAKLSYTDRRNWERSVGSLKGLDFRWEDLKCRSINELADWRIRDQRENALGDKVKGKRRGEEIGAIINADLATRPPTVEEWETAIALKAVESYQKGYLLFGFAPDLPAKKAGSLIENMYGRTRRRYGKPKQRARWQDWLPLIVKFETEEVAHKASSQTFVHYRRALDGIRFA